MHSHHALSLEDLASNDNSAISEGLPAHSMVLHTCQNVISVLQIYANGTTQSPTSWSW